MVKKLFWAVAAAGILQASSFAVSFNANELFVANTTSATFGQFTVGYSFDPSTTSSFVAFPGANGINGTFASTPGIEGWYANNNAIVPAAVVNTNATTTITSYGATVQSHQIILHEGFPGPDAYTDPSASAILRFEAVTAGYYSLSGAFQMLHLGIALPEIYVNGQSVYSGYGDFSSLGFNLAAGSFIDFAVSEGPGGIGGDSTGLFATVTTPDGGTTAVLLGLSITSMALNRRKMGMAS